MRKRDAQCERDNTGRERGVAEKYSHTDARERERESKQVSLRDTMKDNV